MPLPPVHGLVALSPYFKRKVLFDPLALVVSATFVDLEPLVLGLAGQSVDHQFWHGYALGLTVYPVFAALTVFFVERTSTGKLTSAYNFLELKQPRVQYPFLTIYLCCIAGAFSHLFIDMFTHQSMPYVIYPLATGNPFYLGQASGVVEIVAAALAIFTVLLWVKNAKAGRGK